MAKYPNYLELTAVINNEGKKKKIKIICDLFNFKTLDF